MSGTQLLHPYAFMTCKGTNFYLLLLDVMFIYYRNKITVTEIISLLVSCRVESNAFHIENHSKLEIVDFNEACNYTTLICFCDGLFFF
jgi:hypothetical protein